MATPQILTIIPESGASNVPVSSYISVTFDQNMNPDSISIVNFLLIKIINPATFSYITMPGNIQYDQSNNTAIFLPVSDMSYDNTYRVILKGDENPYDSIRSGIRNINNEPLLQDYLWEFTTEADTSEDDDSEEDDVTDEDEVTISGYLKVVDTIPKNNEIIYTDPFTKIAFNDNVILPNSGITTFNEFLSTQDEVIRNKITVYMKNVLGSEMLHYITPMEQITYDYILDDNILTLTLTNSGTLPYNSQYYVTINPGLSGETSYAMQSVYQYTFITQLLPMYSTPALMRLNAGEILNNFDDVYLYRVIHKYSKEIFDVYNAAGKTLAYFIEDTSHVPLVVRQWVLCMAKLTVLRQLEMSQASTGGGSISLGDFSMKAGDIKDMLAGEIKDLEDCIAKTSAHIESLLFTNSRIDNCVPHQHDPRSPWYDRGGKFRHVFKKEPPDVS